jgi:hypothetical protein
VIVPLFGRPGERSEAVDGPIYTRLRPVRRLLFLAPALALLYVRVIRPWQLRWGATDEEIGSALPGDELVARPTFNATRAVTIDAPPDLVWPWLLQVGVTRAGWYSYDLLDNLGRPSARTIIPELQDLKVGDVVPLSPDGRSGPRVLAMEPGRSMVWGAAEATWTWVLQPMGGSGTRLLTRNRIHYRWLHPSIIFNLLIEFADIVMIRRMLLNVKERAEELWIRQQSGRVDAP